MTEKVLCVDDDPNILAALQRTLRRHFTVETARGGEEGLRVLAEAGPFAVVTSDMRMPGMDGVQFLAQVRARSPDTVRIMLTGMTDQRTAMEAVNEGHIFRFLTKPCPPEQLARAIAAGLEQHRLIVAEREVLEKTLRGALRVLADILAMVKPAAYGRAARVRRVARLLAQEMGVEPLWQIEIAAMLSQIGCVTLPEETLEKVCRGRPLSAEEARMYAAHPRVGAELIAHIPRLEAVAEIIAEQELRFDGAGAPDGERRGPALSLGARILHAALDFDALTAAGRAPWEAVREMQADGGHHDAAVLGALAAVVAAERRYERRRVPIEHLTPSMILDEDVLAPSGLLLIGKGQEVTESMTLRLRNFRRLGMAGETLSVLVPIVGQSDPTEAPLDLQFPPCPSDLRIPSSQEAAS